MGDNTQQPEDMAPMSGDLLEAQGQTTQVLAHDGNEDGDDEGEE